MNYRMPAEWEPHEATWLSWPHNTEHWPGKFEPIPPVFARMAKAILPGERVRVCINDEAMETAARAVLAAEDITDGVEFFHISTNASWMRDHGPVFVYDERGILTITDWIFNMWGGKYPPWDKDDVVPLHIGAELSIPVIAPGIVMEGGSLDVNGRGALLTTTQCLLHKNRNPKLSEKDIEGYLERYLGATNILWLKEGIIGDDTDGHIDDIARFTDANTIVCAVEKNARDENYSILKKNYADLERMRDQDGKQFTVVPMPMPSPVIYDNRRLPASYINFYIANSTVLVPTFQCKADDEALATFAKLFPGRKVVGIDCTDLVWGLGTIHCSTQQQPLALS